MFEVLVAQGLEHFLRLFESWERDFFSRLSVILLTSFAKSLCPRRHRISLSADSAIWGHMTLLALSSYQCPLSIMLFLKSKQRWKNQ